MNIISSLFDFLADKIGNVSMGTTATTITGAIAELKGLTTTITGTTIPSAIGWKDATNDYVAPKTWVTIPSGAKEVYVSVLVIWTASRKVYVDFSLPIKDALFPSDFYGEHVNYWGSTSDGFVRIQTNVSSGTYYVRLQEAYNGTTDVTNNTYCRVYYR